MKLLLKRFGRLNKAVNYISAVVEQIDPELILVTLLDTLNQYAAACIAQLNAFKGNQNVGQLTNANANIDAMISAISQIPFVAISNQKGALSKAANAYLEYFG